MQSVGHQEVHMALCVHMMSSSGQEHAGCLLLSGEVLFIVSVCEDTQQQAFPITEVQCVQDARNPENLTLTLQQHRVTSDSEVNAFSFFLTASHKMIHFQYFHFLSLRVTVFVSAYLSSSTAG